MLVEAIAWWAKVVPVSPLQAHSRTAVCPLLECQKICPQHRRVTRPRLPSPNDESTRARAEEYRDPSARLPLSSSMLALRRILATPNIFKAQLSSQFHSSAAAMVKVGDKIPDLDVLMENSPGNKVNLANEITSKGLIIGVPAAYSERYTI